MKFINRLAVPAVCVSAVLAAGCSAQSGSGTTETVSQVTTEATTQAVTESVTGAQTESVTTKAAETTEYAESTTQKEESTEKDFYVTDITDELFEKMKGKSYSKDCTVPREDLRYIHVLHKDIDGVTHEGELVCNKAIAHDVIEIFKELYEASYPIEKMVLVDEYDADDEASMRDNNSSAFNFRFISGTEDISMHGEGLAVDINPLYNPFVTYNYEIGEWYVEPGTAWDYVDREWDFPYKIEEDDLCVRLFKQHGFVWGGDWEEEQDYQHFEKHI